MSTILQIAQVIVYVAGAILFVVMIKAEMKIVVHDVRALQAQQLLLGNALNNMSNTLTQVAVQDNRINHIEDDLRDLKNGKG